MVTFGNIINIINATTTKTAMLTVLVFRMTLPKYFSKSFIHFLLNYIEQHSCQ